MFFEVTPPRPKIRNQTSADEDVAILSLAPFSAIPKICFENVKVGVNATRRICIKNPWSFIIDVAILKVPEVNNEEIDVSWTSTDITACGETILELHWCPKEPGAWRDVLRISNEHSKLKRDVYVIFKAVLPKQVKSPTKQRGRIVSSRPSFVTTKVRKVYNSNKKRLSISPKKRQSLSPKKRRSISPKRKSPKIVQKSTSSVHPFSFTQPRNHPTSSLSSKAHTYPQQRSYPKELQKNNKENYNPNTGVMDNFTAKNVTYDEKYGNENNISFNLSFNQHNHNVDFSFDLKSPLSRANALTVPANYNYNRKSTFDVINGPEIFNNRKATFDVFNRPQIFIENETFNDSLENIIEDTPKLSETTVNFSTLLNSESFCFTPLDKRESKRDVLANNTLFRRIDTEIKFSPQILPTPRNDTFDVSQNISTNTYTKDPVTPQLSPISTKNLDQKDGYSNQCSFLNNCDQISPILRGSFNNASITSQANISTSTQKNFDFNYSGRQAKNVIEANLWSDNNISQNGSTFVATSPKQPKFLSCIQEETHVSYESPFKKPKTYEEPRRRQTTCNSWTKMDALKIKRLSMRNSTITEKSVRLHNPDEIIYRLTNPDPFSAVITHDPFMSSTLCYDEQWVYKQELEFKKWLNALLTPHMELECKETQSKIDIAKIWEKSRNKDVVYAPSKETVSSLYHTNNRLNSLRKKSIALFNSSEITGVLSKVMSIIERKKITIRDDKNLHLDLGLQAEIMQLLLCYNPLWLRIGLESVYGETIPLRSNSDIIGLSTFIILRFFTDPFLKQKHSVANVRNVYLPTFAPAMKKFTLKKFLMLVYFLDQAKLKKLIPHDPCLFCTNAPIKESRQILLEFSKELLAGVGDITKYLKVAGCVLTYKQVALDEFVYAVKDVGTDLRDGVRLTRVMEIILMRNDLSKYMRTPAISRLQKIHNVKVAFTALEEAGFVLLGDIAAKDIVEGHREKTLSLLWQIIYKFRAPIFNEAAKVIQEWWRSFRIIIIRRIRQKQRHKILYEKQNRAAFIIQKYFRSYILTLKTRYEYLRKISLVRKVQNRFRATILMRKQRAKFLKIISSVEIIQQHLRATLVMKIYREEFLRLKYSVILIQRWFRSTLPMKKQRIIYKIQINAIRTIQAYLKATLTMRNQREHYLRLRNNTVTIQKRVRATLLMRQQRAVYLKLRSTIIKIQALYRMKRVRNKYLIKLQAIRCIQQHFRAYSLMKSQRGLFTKLRESAIIIQGKWRATLLMRQQRIAYLTVLQQLEIAKQEKAANVIVNHIQAFILMKKQRCYYLQLKSSALIIQNRYRTKQQRQRYLKTLTAIRCLQSHLRATLSMRRDRENYINKLHAIRLIQTSWRATLQMKTERKKYLVLLKSVQTIQNYYRNYRLSVMQRNVFLKIKNSTILIQNHWRATLLMREHKNEFIRFKNATKTLQTRFRAQSLMKKVRQDYLSKINAVKCIQHFYRSYKLMTQQRWNYLKLKNSTVKIQIHWRATLLMQKQRTEFIQIQNAVKTLQRRFRAKLLMKKARKDYLAKIQAAKYIQNFYRSYKLMTQQKSNYIDLKKKVLSIQSHWRATLLMRKDRNEFIRIQNATKTLQTRLRAQLLMKKVRQDYLIKIQASKCIQNFYRSYKIMTHQKSQYFELKKSTLIIQNRWRATLLMRKHRKEFIRVQIATSIIQSRLRAQLLMKAVRKDYLRKVEAARCIQNFYRSYKIMIQQRSRYLKLKNTALIIQNRWKATLLMRKHRNEFIRIQIATNIIQSRLRAQLSMKIALKDYLRKIEAAKCIQNFYRRYKLMTKQKSSYLKLKNSALIIQNRWRATVLMRNHRKEFIRIQIAANIIQSRFRAFLLMKKVRKDYLRKIEAAKCIQNFYRSYKLMTRQRSSYLRLKNSTLIVQSRFRATILMRKQRSEFIQIQNATKILQTRFRAQILMRKTRMKYLKMVKSAQIIQNYYRGYKIMMRDRLYYLKLKNSPRMILMRKYGDRFTNIDNATKTIQSRFRAQKLMKQTRQDYIRKLNATITIQKYYRAYLCMRQQREKYLQIKRSIIFIQNKWRTMIQIKRESAATKIQAYFRGYIIRKQQCKKMKLIRQRSIEATLKATTENTVGFKCSRIMDYFLSERMTILSLCHALQQFDILTTVCPTVCVGSVIVITDQIFLIFDFSNRSEPYRQACTLGSNVLNNFIGYQGTRTQILRAMDVEKINILLKLMNAWADKDFELFPNLCTFLWILCQNEEQKQLIKEASNSLVMLRNMHTKAKRLETIKTNKHQHGHQKIQKLKLPTTKSWWKDERFTNSLFGITSILKLFNNDI